MANKKIASAMVGSIGTNCYFLINEDCKEGLVFDPGDEAEKISQFARQEGWKISAIFLTHGHADHMGGAARLRDLTGAKIYALDEEEEMLLDAKKNLSVFILRKAITLDADVFLHDGEEIELSGIKLKVLHTPGHTPGGCSFYCEEAGAVFSGDTLFAESVGRTDFPGGSMSQIVHSIKERLLTLPDETVVYPGHGETTTIEHEKKYNPFIA